jgi:hypothetical protein
MADAEAAILRALQEMLLNPAVLERAVWTAAEQLANETSRQTTGPRKCVPWRRSFAA